MVTVVVLTVLAMYAFRTPPPIAPENENEEDEDESE